VQRKVVSVVGNVDVPNDASKFPLFRAGTPLPDGVVYTWWLWDGTKSWRIGKLPPEQIELPIEEVVNYAALVHMIESGWTPATDKITLRSIKAD
jgi:hypothetical protein